MKLVTDTMLTSLPAIGGTAVIFTIATLGGGHPLMAILGYCIGSGLSSMIIKRLVVMYDSIHKR